jgi:hypothetical protein
VLKFEQVIRHREDRSMTGAAMPDLLDKVWAHSLFDALYGRRSRRFGLGFEINEGPFRHKSAQAPLALSETEEALLVGAGAGFSGLALWDFDRSVRRPWAPTLRAAEGWVEYR